MGSDKLGNNDKSLEDTNEALIDEAEALIWSLLDDEIEPTDIKRLEQLLKEKDEVRQRYVACVQMHTDLQHHFTDDSGAQPTDTLGAENLPSSPVLGSLGELRPGTDSLPPVAE